MVKKRLVTLLLAVGIAFSFTEFTSINSVSAVTANSGAYASEFNSISLAKGYKDLNQGNPCMTQRFTADPGVMEYNGRVYVYTTNDEYMYKNGQVTDNTYANIKTLNCMSSSDMVNWTDHGSINAAGNGGAAKWAGCSWAPTACHKKINGKEKFFLYFANNANGIGVLTSDSPTGPWVDPIGHPLISRSTANCQNVTWLFDPAVLVDSDGTGYLYFGGGVPNGQAANPKTARVVKLGNDMTSLAGTPQTIDAPYMFEDSGINKIGNTYYYSYCTNWDSRPNKWAPEIAVIAYMTSNSPMGPWTYKGKVLDNPGKFFGCTGNNHHTIMPFKGKNYIFYHSQWLENKMGTNKGYRNTHVDEVNVGNGQIYETKGTLSGVRQLENVNPYISNRLSNMAWQGGIKTIGQGNTTVEMNRGDWVGVSNVNFNSGVASISVRAASRSGATIKICTDSPSGPVVGYVPVPNTGSNYNFRNISTDISNVSGTKKLFFVASNDCMIDTWQFSTGKAEPQPTPDPTPTPNPTPTPGSTVTLNDGWYYIKNKHAQKYLQVKDNYGKAGQNVELRTGNGAKGQKWYLQNLGGGYVTLKSATGNFMLDVSGGEDKDGANMIIYNAYSGNAQQFVLRASSENGAYFISTKASNLNKVLDDYNFGTSDGTNVCQWSFGGNDNQMWYLEPTNN
ncbi:MAG: carbohydrate-binding protein [Clostridium sp.]|nr:carbohydrate-binding protein [Clostridium sp.]